MAARKTEDEKRLRVDKNLSLWNIITLALVAFGYVYSIAVFQTHVEDFEIQTKEDIIEIENRVEKLESKNETVIRMEEQVKNIRKELHDVHEKVNKLLNKSLEK